MGPLLIGAFAGLAGVVVGALLRRGRNVSVPQFCPHCGESILA